MKNSQFLQRNEIIINIDWYGGRSGGPQGS